MVYGVVPEVPGIEEAIDPEELVPGVTYDVGFWRALPQESQADCVNQYENMCQMVYHSF